MVRQSLFCTKADASLDTGAGTLPSVEGGVTSGSGLACGQNREKHLLMVLSHPVLIPIRHLAPLFDNPKLDKELRAMLREKFPEFCSSPSPPIEGGCQQGIQRFGGHGSC